MPGSMKAALMALSPVFLDSNIFIYHLENRQPYCRLTAALFALIEAGKIIAYTSTLTILEISVGPYRVKRPEIALMQTTLLNQLSHLRIQDLTQDIAHTAAKLRADYKIKTPDAIQLATALSVKAKTVITHDKRLTRINVLSFYVINETTCRSLDSAGTLLP